MILKTLFGPANTRKRLLRDLILVILFTSGAIIVITFIQGADMRDNIAQEYIQQSLTNTSDMIFQFYDPLMDNASLIQKWGIAGVWNIDDAAAITTKLIPIMENLPQARAIKFGEASGHSYLLTHTKNIWMTRTTSPDKPGEIIWKQWMSDQPKKTWVEKKTYDLKERPWYMTGHSKFPQNQANVTWVPPYPVDYNNSFELSVVMTWSSVKEASKITVMALDIPVNGLFNRISEIHVGANGKAFLFDGDTSVYHPENKEQLTGNARFISHHTDVEAPTVRDAMKTWHTREKSSEAFMFSLNGQIYWAGVQPVNADTRDLWIGVVVPENDILSKDQERRTPILWLVLGVMILGLLMAGFIVWKYRHQLRDLPNQVIRNEHFARDVRRLIFQGEGATLEFKSTMRMNLKTGKYDKNIEMAWMKSVSAFMNTTGGMIVIGVNDDGDVIGTTPDGFENQDKCRLHFRNLMNQHIGLEFTKYIHLSMGSIDGHTVMVIECERSSTPVFLINKKEERFYVRSGPSSLSLSMRQMLKYLESRN